MGTSNWQNISYSIDLIRRIRPESLLDVGVGFGRWGIVAREFLDVWDGRVQREQWTAHVEGIEAFPANIDEYHKSFYSKVWEMDASDFFSTLRNTYDLIIFGDVLEHFEKAEGLRLLHIALQQGSYVMVNIPIGHDWEQGSLYGNEFEEHKSEWLIEDFTAFPIVRLREFQDYLGRTFITVLMSKKPLWENKLLRDTEVEKEQQSIENEIKHLKSYANSLSTMIEENREKMKKTISEGEARLSQANAQSKSLIKIKVGSAKNPKSSGSEVWIYDISSDQIPVLDLKKVKKDQKWISRAEQETNTGVCLIASEDGAELEFEILGDSLKLNCLSHAWSGSIMIEKDGAELVNVDLYSNTQKRIDIILNLKDVK